jgi:hypothetical protein
MGNCSDSRFPWPTRSELVFERECGIGGGRREGEGKVVVEVVVVQEETEEAVSPLLLDSPMRAFWVLSRVRARASPSAALAREMELTLRGAGQPDILKRWICRRRRCRISETVAGGNPYISR